MPADPARPSTPPSPPLFLVGHSMPMRAVLRLMAERDLPMVGVVDPLGRVVGAIGDGELRRHLHGLLVACAHDVMRPA